MHTYIPMLALLTCTCKHYQHAHVSSANMHMLVTVFFKNPLTITVTFVAQGYIHTPGICITDKSFAVLPEHCRHNKDILSP